jgi:hypothetical protein
VNLEQRYKKFELSISMLGVYVGIAAVGVAYLDYLGSKKEAEATLDASNRQAETYLYVQLKSRFEEIVKEMPSDRFTKRYKVDPKNTKDWKYFEDYWQQSFDEWYSSTQLLEPKHSHLWDEYYASAIKDALTKSYYVDSLCLLIDERATTDIVLVTPLDAAEHWSEQGLPARGGGRSRAQAAAQGCAVSVAPQRAKLAGDRLGWHPGESDLGDF